MFGWILVTSKRMHARVVFETDTLKCLLEHWCAQPETWRPFWRIHETDFWATDTRKVWRGKSRMRTTYILERPCPFEISPLIQPKPWTQTLGLSWHSEVTTSPICYFPGDVDSDNKTEAENELMRSVFSDESPWASNESILSWDDKSARTWDSSTSTDESARAGDHLVGWCTR